MPCEHHRIHITTLRKNGRSSLNDYLVALQWCAHPKNKKHGQENIAGYMPPVCRRLYCDGGLGGEGGAVKV